MIYEYQCICGNRTDVIRSVEDRNNPVGCSQCGMNMVRTINVPYVRVFQPFVDTNGHYVGCRSDLRDMHHAYNDRTGSELVDTGNDNVKLTPKRHEYPNITTDMIEAVRAH